MMQEEEDAFINNIIIDLTQNLSSPDAPNGQSKSPHSSTGFAFFFRLSVNCDFFGV